MQKTCLITGVGTGTGAALVNRYVADGYKVAMLARSTDRLEELEKSIDEAHAYACDVGDVDALTTTFEEVSSDLGAPNIVVHNAIFAEHGNYMDINPNGLRQAFEINTMALLYLARLATPHMIAEGFGAIICTGNTSAYRGKPRFAGFAPSKAAQRILLESIAREAGPKGIHAAYIAIDAVIDGRMRVHFPEKPDEFFCRPEDIADECFRIAHQPRSAWSSESIIRPYGEEW